MQNEALHYSIYGRGKAVVFLHGFLEDSSMWQFLHLEDLERKCVFIDLPGHGKSKFGITQDPKNGIAIMSQLVRNTLNELGVKKYDVIGHSMGGYVALELKNRDPDCEKVLLFHSHFWEDDDTRKKNRIRFSSLASSYASVLARELIPALFFQREKYLEQITMLISQASNISGDAMSFASLSMMNRKNHFTLMMQNPNDITMIHGRHDPLIPEKAIFEKCLTLSNGIYWLEHAGHMGHIEDPAQTNKLLMKWKESM